MNKKIIKRGIFFSALGLLVITGFSRHDVRAQSAAPAMDLTVKDNVTVPPAKRMSWVNEHSAQAKSAYSHVQNMLDQARQEKDSIKITCLDDKLTQISVNLRGIESRKGAFEAAVSSNDSDASQQHFTMLTIYSSKINSLASEAESCIGGNDVVLGESETKVTVSEDISVDDPTKKGVVVYQQTAVKQFPQSQASPYY
jgi:hypothetical protein